MKYTIKVNAPDDWNEIYDLLTGESNVDYIPNHVVSCTDDKKHSPTRGTFELTEAEANDLANHPKVKWIELSVEDNRDQFPDPSPANGRFKTRVKIYRDLSSANAPPTSNPTAAELNRAGWSVKRVGIKTNGDFWTGSGQPGAIYSDVSYSLTGKNVDVVIHDSGVLQYHPEFLDGNGRTRVKDLVLDGPYHIDPDYFTTNNYTRTKADGSTTGTVSNSISWWENSSNRSSQFQNAGTVSINNSLYTEDRAVGDSLDGSNSLTSGHGTACAGLAAGKNQGAAFEANIWNAPGISDNVGMAIITNYDIIKIFHKYKPVNSETGVKNPTVVNGSWGYQAAFGSSDTVDYKFRGDTGSFSGNAATTNQVTAMKNGLNNQVAGAYRSWSSSSRSNSTDEAASEMMAEGVIYVAAAGNNDQRLGIGSSDPDRLNYMSDEWFNSTDPRSEFPSGTVPCNHRDWMNPQGNGFDADVDPEFHPTICVGALDDNIVLSSGVYKERKASYSNNGSGIDVWAPADETLAPGTNGVAGYTDYVRYDDNRFYDASFNGTSAAAPVVTGVIALYLQANPTATSRQVKNWLKYHGSVDVGEMLQDDYKDDSTTSFWTGSFNLRDARPAIVYSPYDTDEKVVFNRVDFGGNGLVITQS